MLQKESDWRHVTCPTPRQILQLNCRRCPAARGQTNHLLLHGPCLSVLSSLSQRFKPKDVAPPLKQ